VSHSKKNWVRSSKVYIGFHVKFPLFLSYFNGAWIFWRNFEKYSNTKFHENPTSGSWVVPCGQTDGRTDRHTELTVAFWTFSTPLKIMIIKVTVFWDESRNRKPSLVHWYQSFGKTFGFQFKVSFYPTVFLSGVFRNSGTHRPNCMESHVG
jgi:hypothetical protein